MSETAARAAGPVSAAGHVPGEIGIWVLIAGDLALFSLLFGMLLIYRADEPALFAQSRATLSQGLGLINTLLMLTSSWFVATAVQATRRRIERLPGRLFGLAMLCGLAFVAVKYLEYSAKIGAGLTPLTNTFYMLYFVYTGIHLVHVLIGLVVLAALRAYLGRRGVADVKLQHIETGASFWHLVDLLWIVLFALLYLVV